MEQEFSRENFIPDTNELGQVVQTNFKIYADGYDPFAE